MPTIDLEDFLGAIDGREGCSKISLAVFQAVMFAGTSYVDLELLQQAGYATRRAARSDFYQKVKVSALQPFRSSLNIDHFHKATVRL